jgi:16S rRNA processing protein RimM
MVTVGRIVRPHGHRGAVVVQPETDFAGDRFREGAELLWNRGGEVIAVRIAGSFEHQGRWVVTFDGVGTMDDAETLRGLELRVPESALHALPPGAYYVHDLEGCEVVTTSGAAIGRVLRIEFGAAQPLLVVDGGAGGEVLVPMTELTCRRVDTAAKRIVVELPGGLVELNAGAKKGPDEHRDD